MRDNPKYKFGELGKVNTERETVLNSQSVMSIKRKVTQRSSLNLKRTEVEDLGQLILRKTEMQEYKGAKLRLLQKSKEFIPTQLRQQEIEEAT